MPTIVNAARVLAFVLACGLACNKPSRLFEAEDLGVFVGSGLLFIDKGIDVMSGKERPFASDDAKSLVLQLKDSDGHVQWASAVDVKYGIAFDPKRRVDLKALIDRYKKRGFRVIASMQVFKDASFTETFPSDAIMDSSGKIFHDSYGAFVDPKSTTYRRYFYELVDELSTYPIDELLIDYIRYPEYPGLTYPLSGSAPQAEREEVIADFVEGVRATLRKDVPLSAALFVPLSAKKVCQNYELICPHLDVVSPMAYPGLFPEQPEKKYKTTPPGTKAWGADLTTLLVDVQEHTKACKQVRPFIQGFTSAISASPLATDIMRRQLRVVRKHFSKILIFNAKSKYGPLIDAVTE